MTLRVISYGGGVQSTAMLVLAAVRDPDFEAAAGGPIDAALFSNVGDDSEHPDTIDYVANITPWAAERGLPVHTLHRTRRNGTTETLWERLMRPESRSLPIPVRMSNGAPGTRSCTADFKIRVIARWLKANGATADDPATVCIGISTDEIQRVNNRKSGAAHETIAYPLIELGMSRQDCVNVIARHGLPKPRKSACFYCPFHTKAAWQEMRRDEPELFARSAHLEEVLNERRAKLGKDPVWLTRYNKPLHDAISEAQTQLPGFESIGEVGCDTGHCFT